MNKNQAIHQALLENRKGKMDEDFDELQSFLIYHERDYGGLEEFIKRCMDTYHLANTPNAQSPTNSTLS